MSVSLRYFRTKFYDTAAIPIVAIVGTACAGAGWYVWRLSQGPHVVWDRHGNPEPWNDVQQNQNTKFMTVNQKFDSEMYC
ncbi:hypothetical protein BT69DRAFT_830077 [Atractiella rhizophila]|nr:hypothetical protein BT69DRAFT_830077 [Atractiella rhizophila]